MNEEKCFDNLHIVALPTLSKSESPIYVKEDIDKAKIFFRTSDYTPCEKEIMATINSLAFSNQCSGGETKRLFRGDIVIFFNPVCHSSDDREYAIKKVVKAITKPNPRAIIS